MKQHQTSSTKPAIAHDRNEYRKRNFKTMIINDTFVNSDVPYNVGMVNDLRKPNA